LAVKLAPVAVAAASPFPVTVTCAVAVAVDVPGAYCTLMVQFVPGFKTVVAVQVPPAIMEKAPPAVPTFPMVDAAVKVNAPAVAPVAVLVTVTKPLCVVVVPVSNDGDGALMVAVAPLTVKVTAGVVCPPPAMARVTVLAPSAAVGSIRKVAVALVSLATV